jgi:hypothetical protein
MERLSYIDLIYGNLFLFIFFIGIVGIIWLLFI